jgi:hypothetical protein
MQSGSILVGAGEMTARAHDQTVLLFFRTAKFDFFNDTKRSLFTTQCRHLSKKSLEQHGTYTTGTKQPIVAR